MADTSTDVKVELGLMPVVTTMADRGTSVVRFFPARTTFGGPIRPPAVFFTGFKSPLVSVDVEMEGTFL